MFLLRGLGAVDQDIEGGSTQYDEVGEWQTGSSGGGSYGTTSPGPYAPRSPATMYQPTAGAYTLPPSQPAPLVFPPIMPPPLPPPPAPPVPVGPSDVPTAGTNVIPVGPSAAYPGAYTISPTLKRGVFWGLGLGLAAGLIILLVRR